MKQKQLPLGNCLFLVGMLAALLGVSEELSAKEKTKPERYPDFLKVFSRDGSESLTAVCHPKDKTQPKDLVRETTCRFTNVRFEIPPPSKFFRSLEDATKNNPEIAEQFRKDPEKTKREWKEAIGSLQADICSDKSIHRLNDRMKGLENGSKRRQIFAEIVKGCPDRPDMEKAIAALFELESFTCQLWVEHFSLEFKKIDDGKWLYTQQEPSATGTLKVYELTAEPEYGLWTLMETSLMVGRKETAAAKPPEQRIWSWNNWDSYEIPEQCRFLTHEKVQYDFSFHNTSK